MNARVKDRFSILLSLKKLCSGAVNIAFFDKTESRQSFGFARKMIASAEFCQRKFVGKWFLHACTNFLARIKDRKSESEARKHSNETNEVQVKASVGQAQWTMICSKNDVFRSEAKLLTRTFVLLRKRFLPATEIKHFCKYWQKWRALLQVDYFVGGLITQLNELVFLRSFVCHICCPWEVLHTLILLRTGNLSLKRAF